MTFNATDYKHNQWWNKPTDKSETFAPNTIIWQLIDHLDTVQKYRSVDNLKFFQLYTGVNALITPYVFNAKPYTLEYKPKEEYLAYNVIKSGVDTLAAKISKNKPKPMFLTQRGDWAKQKKATLLNQFIEGLFYQENAYEKGKVSFIDGGCMGTGFLKVFSHAGNVKIERIFPEEVIVDDADGLFNNPRVMHQRKIVAREVLLEDYPDYEEQIMQAPRPHILTTNQNTADLVEVIESWHLPSCVDADDGMHCITIRNQHLFDEPYERDVFPIIKLTPFPKLLGFYGQGIAEMLLGKQIEINKTLFMIQKMARMCVPKMIAPKGASVAKGKMTNEIMDIITFAGSIAPTTTQFGTIPKELIDHLLWLINSSFEEIGISMLSAQSKKPQGLDSGKALMEFNDIESDRFILVGQIWEQFFITLAKQCIYQARQCYAEDKDFGVYVHGKNFLKKINWADCDLDDDSFVIQCFPTSQLAQTPSGRFEQIDKYMQAGLIDQDTGKELLQLPDLDATIDLQRSNRDVIKENLQKMVDDEVYFQIEPYQDIQYAAQYANMLYNKIKLDNAPENVLELFRRFIQDCHSRIKAMQEPAQPPAPPMPMANPEPLPTNSMIPNVPEGAAPEMPPMPPMPEGGVPQ